jgi:1-aminocyclopropane-1-carboxylate deaminase
MIAGIEQLVDLSNAYLQPLPLHGNQFNHSIDVLRLDKIHAIISGNKWFKLKHSLNEAIGLKKKNIVTVGGAYSNHVLATACACSELQLHAVAIIRGEQPAKLSCTLEKAAELGMTIEFAPRPFFAGKEKLYDFIHEKYYDCYLVEEGGKNENGIKGAEEILDLVSARHYDYVCCAVGTGTTIAGIIRASAATQLVIGIPAIKINDGANDTFSFIEEASDGKNNFILINDYHFGGYAKYNDSLLEFMNHFYSHYSIPTDFVYTAKLFYGVSDLIRKSYFKKNSKILVIHSGGLQGNCSLPSGTLLF